MSLKRLMLLRQIKSLLLEGKEATANIVAQSIAEDILSKEGREVCDLSPDGSKVFSGKCVPGILEEAKRQLKLDSWDQNDSEQQGAA